MDEIDAYQIGGNWNIGNIADSDPSRRGSVGNGALGAKPGYEPSTTTPMCLSPSLSLSFPLSLSLSLSPSSSSRSLTSPLRLHMPNRYNAGVLARLLRIEVTPIRNEFAPRLANIFYFADNRLLHLLK